MKTRQAQTNLTALLDQAHEAYMRELDQEEELEALRLTVKVHQYSVNDPGAPERAGVYFSRGALIQKRGPYECNTNALRRVAKSKTAIHPADWSGPKSLCDGWYTMPQG